MIALPQDSVEAWLGALNGRASFNGDLEATSMLLQTPALDSEESLAVRGRLGSWRNLIDASGLLEMRNDEALVGTVISKRDAQGMHLMLLRRAIDQIADLSDSVAALAVR